LWANNLGTHDVTFAAAIFAQIAEVATGGPTLTDMQLNCALSIVRGIAPTDPVEALLATQMTAVHLASIAAARRLNNVETIEQQHSASGSLNKLARTFAAQVEALKRHRSNGDPTIKSQTVTVNDGGQAIVGTVHHAGSLENRGQSHEPHLRHESGPALLGHLEAHQEALPGPGGERPARVPVPRSASRGAQRQGERLLQTRPLQQRGRATASRRRPLAS
jgi:hypothetical protein